MILILHAYDGEEGAFDREDPFGIPFEGWNNILSLPDGVVNQIPGILGPFSNVPPQNEFGSDNGLTHPELRGNSFFIEQNKNGDEYRNDDLIPSAPPHSTKLASLLGPLIGENSISTSKKPPLKKRKKMKLDKEEQMVLQALSPTSQANTAITPRQQKEKQILEHIESKTGKLVEKKIPEYVGERFLKEIPYSQLNKTTNWLTAYHASIKSITSDINQFQDLVRLDLSSNGLYEVDNLKCPHIMWLNLSDNRLISLPPSLAKLPIQYLNLSKNLFKTIDLSAFKNLLFLDLSLNKLSMFPATAVEVEYLDISYQGRHYFSMNEVSSLKKLTHLIINNLNIGLNETITKLDSLIYIEVKDIKDKSPSDKDIIGALKNMRLIKNRQITIIEN